ncbi:hypothetical protein BC941DRAFT_435153 [Chlamydoabsidia padenii]|nr:hypothetical protein BC941DRAFT_435153 [Chlamydoabsidia padenii]
MSITCLNQQTVSLPMPMEPRYIDGKVRKQFDSITDDPSLTSSCIYPHSRLFPLSSLSSSSLSSGSSSTSLCTPSSSSNSLNMASSVSSSTLQTPLTCLNVASSENICLPPPSLTDLLPAVDQEPVLFYPPAHVCDSYRSHAWNSLWQMKTTTTTATTTDINYDDNLDQHRRLLWSSSSNGNN